MESQRHNLDCFNMEKLDCILNLDCLLGMKKISDKSVDLIITDPPYELQQCSGAGAFGRKNREYYQQIDNLQNGIRDMILREMLRVCKKPNMYIFCSKDQLPQLLMFAVNNGLKYDILTWHKTNPVPTCNNKYLSDTEYIVFMRKGANLYGTYETKRKYFITQTNTTDKKLWGHPTIKPLNIIETLLLNSSLENDIILDPFMGSGTTAIACMRNNRHFIGFEINGVYYKTSLKRIQQEKSQLNLF